MVAPGILYRGDHPYEAFAPIAEVEVLNITDTTDDSVKDFDFRALNPDDE